MTIREWIKDRQLHGRHCFSLKDIREAFSDMKENTVNQELSILVSQRIISLVYKGFYVIVPPQYGLSLKIPAYYYIDHLMHYLGKPYYLSLLTAAALWGAAHQRPQRTSVMTIPPRARTSTERNNDLLWCYRPAIPTQFLCRKNSETGTILYSNAELTAIDLVQYSHLIGGLSRAATVLAELAENLDFSKPDISQLFEYTTTPTLQRLGFILDEILEEKELADRLYNKLKAFAPRLTYQSLSKQVAPDKSVRNSRWKIYINTIIEPDDI